MSDRILKIWQAYNMCTFNYDLEHLKFIEKAVEICIEHRDFSLAEYYYNQIVDYKFAKEKWKNE